jgi:uncharacterized protein (TIGR03083 family)
MSPRNAFAQNGTVDGSSLRQAARASAAFLTSVADRDWNVPIPDMTWSVTHVAAHMGEVVLWYATDLAGGPRELSTLEMKVREDAAHEELVESVTACATVLEYVVDAAPPGRRGWHPAGLADASGFAAMGCDELLVHTDDVARGLDVPFHPPPALSEMLVARLFPWAPDDVDPWRALLWANGRIALDGHDRQTSWRPHPTPLAEWDGTPNT